MRIEFFGGPNDGKIINITRPNPVMRIPINGGSSQVLVGAGLEQVNQGPQFHTYKLQANKYHYVGVQ